MDPHNPRRTVRALEVIELTGRPYSASLPRYRYVSPSVQIGLDLPREDLDARIDERTRRMFDDGFIDEVERLRPHLGMTAARALGYQQVILPREDLDARIDERTRRMFDDGFIDEVERLRPHLGMTAARALGYQQVIDYLDGLRDLDETMADVAQKTRRLARKQMGWFGRDPRIHWLQALNPRLVDNAMAVIGSAATRASTCCRRSTRALWTLRWRSSTWPTKAATTTSTCTPTNTCSTISAHYTDARASRTRARRGETPAIDS